MASKKRKAIDLTADDSDEAAPDLAQLHREREARQPWRLRRPGASWTGEAKYDDDEVRELRERLTRTNHGSPGLEVLRPGEDGGYDVERAASLFRRDGCVVLLDALDPARLEALRRGVERAAAVVPYAVPAGNRGAQRWSLGVASLTRQLSHVKAWADCVHVPRIAPVLEEIMGPNYVCTGMGGELTAPGAVDYQELHSDLGDGDVVYDGVRMKNWDAPSAPAVVVNFAVCDLHDLNGPTAQVTAAVAGFSTQTRRCPGDADPRRDEFRLSTVLVGGRLPAGSVVVRDPRAWHAGTVNVTADELRPLPNVEYAPAWNAGWCAPSMPPRVHAGLDAEGRRLCARIVDDEPDRAYGWRAEHPRVDGWALGNRDAQREYRVYAAAPAAVAVLAQDDYGVVDVGLRGALATKNADAGDPVYLPAPATITALEVFEQGGSGVVDVRLVGVDAAGAAVTTARAFPERSYTARRTVSAPATGFAGLAVREQDGYGVVDLKVV